MAGLKVRLKKQAALVGSGVSRAFLRSQALLFGGYRDALQCLDVSDTESRNITFKFINIKFTHNVSVFDFEGRVGRVL